MEIFAKLVKLKKLDLSMNDISDIPESVQFIIIGTTKCIDLIFRAVIIIELKKKLNSIFT